MEMDARTSGTGTVNEAYRPDDIQQIDTAAPPTYSPLRVDPQPADGKAASSKSKLRQCYDRVHRAQTDKCTAAGEFYDAHRSELCTAVCVVLALLWLAYLIAVLVINPEKAVAVWVISVAAGLALAWCFARRLNAVGKALARLNDACGSAGTRVKAVPYIEYIVLTAVIAAIAIFLIVDTWNSRIRLLSANGILFLIFVSWLFSNHRQQIAWRPVLWGILLQFAFGLLILRWSVGRRALQFVADQVTAFLGYTFAGSQFIYGHLVRPASVCIGGKPIFGPVFAFGVLSTVIFFSSFIAFLYYLGVLQLIIIRVATVMQWTMGTTAAETLSTAGNIFVGQTEAPLMIKPYLHMLTMSELHAVMASGFATIAGTVFKIYVDFGACAEHLLAASVMSAPAALAVSKLLYPETEESLTKRIDQLKLGRGSERNALEAIAGGATAGIYLVLNICANLIAFVALLAFCNAVVGYLGELVDVPGLTLETLVGYVMYPLAFLLGTGTDHAQLLLVGRLIGVKTLVNEFVAYEEMGKLADAGELNPRALLISTYALCGFSNVTAIGIQLGGLGAMCPERRADLAAVALRALAAGAIACFMTACVAGLLTEEVARCSTAVSVVAANCTELMVKIA